MTKFNYLQNQYLDFSSKFDFILKTLYFYYQGTSNFGHSNNKLFLILNQT